MIAICRLLNAVLIMLTGLTVAGAAEPDAPIAPHQVIKLFNGRDLSGWATWLVDTKRQDLRGVYSVRDGMIRISGDGFGYLSTDRAYKDYRLVVEVKWGTQNSRTRKGLARDSGPPAALRARSRCYGPRVSQPSQWHSAYIRCASPLTQHPFLSRKGDTCRRPRGA